MGVRMFYDSTSGRLNKKLLLTEIVENFRVMNSKYMHLAEFNYILSFYKGIIDSGITFDILSEKHYTDNVDTVIKNLEYFCVYHKIDYIILDPFKVPETPFIGTFIIIKDYNKIPGNKYDIFADILRYSRGCYGLIESEDYSTSCTVSVKPCDLWQIY